MTPIDVLSLGAGVQSSTLALMAAAGDLPAPDCAIFADTQAEPRAVYDWLDWLTPRLPFPVYRVTAGNLADVSKRIRTSRNGNRYTDTNIPVFIKNPIPGEREGIQSRQCTGDFKIDPINRKLRELARPAIRAWRRGGRVGAAPVRQWVGISLDEVTRMKPARQDFIDNVWPLIDRRMRRSDCLRWMESHGFPRPPRSACIFCPYHSDAEWLALKETAPDEFAAAARWETEYQASLAQIDRVRGVPFLHSSCVPLSLVPFDADRRQPNLFENECEGMCGV